MSLFQWFAKNNFIIKFNPIEHSIHSTVLVCPQHMTAGKIDFWRFISTLTREDDNMLLATAKVLANEVNDLFRVGIRSDPKA